MVYILISLIILFLWTTLHWFYQIHILKKWIKEFSPVIHKHENTELIIGKVSIFTEDMDIELSQYKDVLKQILKKIEYRMATFTSVQNSNYRVTNIVNNEPIYSMKTDSEKWLEQGKMSWYIDIRSDIEYLLSKENSAK